MAQTNELNTGKLLTTSDVTQNAATVNAGGNLAISAGQDLTATASTISATGNVALSATNDLSLSSAADEAHSYSKTHRATNQTDHVAQVATTVTAGANLALSSGADMTVSASQVKAAGDVSVNAGQDLLVASGLNEDSSYYYKKSKKSFGRSTTHQSQSYQSTNVGSVIEAGHDLTVNASQDASGAVSINGGRDVTVVGSQLKAANDLLVGGTGDVMAVSGTQEQGAYNKKTKSGLFGLSKSGSSELKTSLPQVGSDLQAGHDAVIASGRDVALQASQVTAGNDAEIQAGLIDNTGTINLLAASDTAYSQSDAYKSKIGLSASHSGFSVSTSLASSEQSGHIISSSTGQGSGVSAGANAMLGAAQDINLQGGSVIAKGTATFSAGRDVNIVAATNTNAASSWSKQKNLGLSLVLDSNGASFFDGQTTARNTSDAESSTALASQVSAQDISVQAGRDVVQQGSDLSAQNNLQIQAGRNVLIDAAAEHSTLTTSQSVEKDGIGAGVTHNYGNTVKSTKAAGQGDDVISKVASTLKAIDGINQFLGGPTASATIGSSRQSQTVTQSVASNRTSTLTAGNDINVTAGADVTVTGASVAAGRDISVKGTDITLNVASGSQTLDARQKQTQGGLSAGTAGGLKIGVGASGALATQNSNQGSSAAANLTAGRDVMLDATHDLTLVGTQVQADGSVDLAAGNDLSIKGAENDSTSTQKNRSLGGSVGIAVGSSGVGLYASANIGRGNLDSNAQQQQQAYIYAGDRLAFSSGRDTAIAGATLRGDEVTGAVGRNLTVSSVADTGSISGRQMDASATVVVGPGAGVSGSLGYGRTTGTTDYVVDQTAITAKNALNIHTQAHTQLDGALLNSDTGQLTLDTGTLGHTDIAGQDTEHAYYVNVGGTYGLQQSTTQDGSQVGKGEPGANGWSVSGYNYTRDKEQIVRATVGAGSITVRDDAGTGVDSTATLNRDASKAYEVTKDEEHQTNLYASSSSVNAVLHPVDTATQWASDAKGYGTAQAALIKNGVNQLQAAAITSSDVPAAAKSALGDEQALEITRKLVAQGVGTNSLAQWSSDTFDKFATLADDASALGDCGKKLPCRR